MAIDEISRTTVDFFFSLLVISLEGLDFLNPGLSVFVFLCSASCEQCVGYCVVFLG